MVEEEAGVEATHVVVALKPSVHDSRVTLLGDALLGHFLVYPVRIPPHLGPDFAKLDGGGGILLDSLLERLVEIPVIEEDVGVVVPAVEVALDGLH